MSLIEDIEAEVGPLSEVERQMVEQELDLLGTFALRLADRIPVDATTEIPHGEITELLHEDAELFAAFSRLMDVSGSNRGSPLRSLSRLRRSKEEDEGP